MSGERLAQAREMIEGVLQGKITAQTHPAVLEDDLLCMSVRMVEQDDWPWLQGRLGDPGVPRERRLEIVSSLSPAGRRAVQALAG
jgi:hypothetical protein